MRPIAPKLGRLLSVREAAQYLGVTESKARTLIARGELRAVRNANGRISGAYEADCDAYLEQARQQPETAAAVTSADVDAQVRALPGSNRFH